MAIRRPSFAGLSTTFGAAWGRAVTIAGAEGGRFFRPDAGRPDEALGLLVYLPGYGQDYIAGLSKLALTNYRGAHRGLGFYVLALQGTFTLGGSNRTLNGNDALLPINNSYPWVGSTAYSTPGTRRTNAGNTYFLLTAGTSAASGGPTGTGTAIVDGTCVWRWVATGVTDSVIPDRQWIAGDGSDGLPIGVVREFLSSGYNIDRSRVAIMGYSTGGGMADTLGRAHPDIFTHIIDSAGCGPNGTGDHNYFALTQDVNRYRYHESNDVTVNFNGNPPGPSSAAIGNHPSAIATIETFANSLPGATTITMTSTGQTYTFAATGTTTIYTGGDRTDLRGNTIKFRAGFASGGAGHNFSPNTTKAWYETGFIDDNPRR